MRFLTKILSKESAKRAILMNVPPSAEGEAAVIQPNLPSVLWLNRGGTPILFGREGAMTLVQSVRSVVWKYFALRGRAGRREFWWWVLAYVTAIIIAGRIDLHFDGMLFGGIANMPPLPIATFVFLALLPAHIAVSARRLHDVGRSAWLLAIGIIPVIGVLVLLWHFAMPSVAAMNRHGRPPAGIMYY